MRRPAKRCVTNGCPGLVYLPGARCADCRGAYEAQRAAARPSRRAPGVYDAEYLRNRARCLSEESACALCGGPGLANDTADHKRPLSRGGSNDRENLQRAHRRCNERKNRGAA